MLAPVCAEYLSAYDDSTGDPVALISGLWFFVPLYGVPALVIREVARRRGLGWAGILLMATAAGLLQAGVVDQSLFSTDYRQIEGWQEIFSQTLIVPWGVSAVNLLNFVGGHVIFSFCAPIALIEAVRPATASRPWLGKLGLGLLSLLWVPVAVMLVIGQLTTETSHASSTQLIVSSLVIAALIAAGLLARRRPARTVTEREAPRVWVVGGVAVVLAAVAGVAPQTWVGVAMVACAYLLAGLVIRRWSRRSGWGLRHVAVVAAAPLLDRALLAFTYDPVVGEVSAAAYGHKATMLAIVLGLATLALAARSSDRVRPDKEPADVAS